VETKLHTLLATLKVLMLKTLVGIVKKKPFNVKPTICIAFANKGKTQVRVVATLKQRVQSWTIVNKVPLNGSSCCVLYFDEMTMKSPCWKAWKNIVGMGVHKIIEQMGKVDSENSAKIVIPEKWLTMTSNWRHYRHPLASPNWKQI